MRLFIAFDLPPAVKMAARGIQQVLMKSSAHVGWVREEGLHLTLKFLGDVEPPKLPGIEEAMALASAGTGPITISIRGVGVFPDSRNPRVIWLGVETPDDRMIRLRERIERALDPLGFPSEKRKFHLHLTVGRIRSPRRLGGLTQEIEAHKKDSAGDCEVRELHLIQSDLRPGGAIYTRLKSVSL